VIPLSEKRTAGGLNLSLMPHLWMWKQKQIEVARLLPTLKQYSQFSTDKIIVLLVQPAKFQVTALAPVSKSLSVKTFTTIQCFDSLLAVELSHGHQSINLKFNSLTWSWSEHVVAV
jgi:hypothetical protein